MVVPFLLVYGVSYFFTEFGLKMTTFVMPSELYPVAMRATGHGISAGVGKLGAFIGVFLFPVLQTSLACAARSCSPPGYPSSASRSPSCCPNPPGAAWKTSPLVRAAQPPGPCRSPIRRQCPNHPRL
jgi:hypothetical protein